MIRKNENHLLSRLGQTIAAIGMLTLTGILGWTVWTLPPFSDQMSALISSKMPISGVDNPVTAVLLNFRGYDTLLEIGVLLLAAVGVLSVAPSAVMPADSAPSPILILLLRLLLPFIILVSGYMIIRPSSIVASTTTITIMVIRLSTIMCSNFLRNACMQSSIIEGDLGCQRRLYARIATC